MKVTYIGKFEKLWDEESIARGLESAGAEVVRISDREPYQNILTLIKREKPDVVLGAKYQFDGAWKLFEEMRDMHIPTASWTFDLIIGHPPREVEIDTFPFFNANLVLMTDGGHEEEYQKHGIQKHSLRQGIPDEFCYKAEAEPKYDIIFVGTENPTFPYRQDMLEYLKKTYGERMTWFGRRDTNDVRGHDLNTLIAETKIVIGDSMYAPREYWSNRIYETIGRGGFIIHPMIDGLEKEFEPYKEFLPYAWGDYEGLKTKIDYFLSHDKERRAIADAGFERVKREYKMSDRTKILHKYLVDLCNDYARII